uniref:Protein goliath-like n=1 Tax=Hirondellea gigas TaxID=1518452 RepID=A0A6A7FSN4_9CRUS
MLQFVIQNQSLIIKLFVVTSYLILNVAVPTSASGIGGSIKYEAHTAMLATQLNFSYIERRDGEIVKSSTQEHGQYAFGNEGKAHGILILGIPTVVGDSGKKLFYEGFTNFSTLSPPVFNSKNELEKNGTNTAGWKKKVNIGCVEKFPTPPRDKPWVALISRETCPAKEDIRLALELNASAILIYWAGDYQRPEPLHPPLYTKNNRTTVVVYVDKEQYDRLSSALINGTVIVVNINRRHGSFRLADVNRTSVLFVSVSFIVLMVVSLAWLVFYYIQRFRYINAKDRLQKHLSNAAKKALSKIPVKNIKSGDKEISLEECCAICIEPYAVAEAVRVLPCKHEFHKMCVDPWLLNQRTCPMCKMDILKHYGYAMSGSDDSGLHVDSVSSLQADDPNYGINNINNIHNNTLNRPHHRNNNNNNNSGGGGGVSGGSANAADDSIPNFTSSTASNNDTVVVIDSDNSDSSSDSDSDQHRHRRCGNISRGSNSNNNNNNNINYLNSSNDSDVNFNNNVASSESSSNNNGNSNTISNNRSNNNSRSNNSSNSGSNNSRNNTDRTSSDIIDGSSVHSAYSTPTQNHRTVPSSAAPRPSSSNGSPPASAATGSFLRSVFDSAKSKVAMLGRESKTEASKLQQESPGKIRRNFSAKLGSLDKGKIVDMTGTAREGGYDSSGHGYAKRNFGLTDADLSDDLSHCSEQDLGRMSSSDRANILRAIESPTSFNGSFSSHRHKRNTSLDSLNHKSPKYEDMKQRPDLDLRKQYDIGCCDVDSVDSHEFTDALEDITPQATPKLKKSRFSKTKNLLKGEERRSRSSSGRSVDSEVNRPKSSYIGATGDLKDKLVMEHDDAVSCGSKVGLVLVHNPGNNNKKSLRICPPRVISGGQNGSRDNQSFNSHKGYLEGYKDDSTKDRNGLSNSDDSDEEQQKPKSGKQCHRQDSSQEIRSKALAESLASRRKTPVSSNKNILSQAKVTAVSNRRRSSKITPAIFRNHSVDDSVSDSYSRNETVGNRKCFKNSLDKSSTKVDIHKTCGIEENYSSFGRDSYRSSQSSAADLTSGYGGYSNADFFRHDYSYDPYLGSNAEYDPTLRDMRPSLSSGKIMVSNNAKTIAKNTISQPPAADVPSSSSRVRPSQSIPGLSSYANPPMKINQSDVDLTASHPSLHSSQGYVPSTCLSDYQIKHQTDLHDLKQRLVNLHNQTAFSNNINSDIVASNSSSSSMPKSRHGLQIQRKNSTLVPSNKIIRQSSAVESSTRDEEYSRKSSLDELSYRNTVFSSTNSSRYDSSLYPNRNNKDNSLNLKDFKNEIGFKGARSRKVSPSGIPNRNSGVISVTGTKTSRNLSANPNVPRSTSFDVNDSDTRKKSISSVQNVSHA